jgi:nucleotide-binding universal stress UspA family protein
VIAERGCIVCGVDDSPSSASALAVSTQLCDRLGWRLVVVHAIRALWCDIYAADIARVEEEKARRLMQRMLDETQFVGDVELRIVTGHPGPAIASVTAKERAAMACIGISRVGRLRLALGGSTAISLRDAAPCPVLVVPPTIEVDTCATPASLARGDGRAGRARSEPGIEMEGPPWPVPPEQARSASHMHRRT